MPAVDEPTDPKYLSVGLEADCDTGLVINMAFRNSEFELQTCSWAGLGETWNVVVRCGGTSKVYT